MFFVKRFEQILIKLIIIQFIMLIAAQLFLCHSELKPYLSKAVQYEGVGNMSISEWVETISR
ncbi:DUF5359 family protein [Aeribacillus composti]|nr:DUF5359 family protein [Aeribacillus composti]